MGQQAKECSDTMGRHIERMCQYGSCRNTWFKFESGRRKFCKLHSSVMNVIYCKRKNDNRSRLLTKRRRLLAPKRNCNRCGVDISDLHLNRKRCKSPDCKQWIKEGSR